MLQAAWFPQSFVVWFSHIKNGPAWQQHLSVLQSSESGLKSNQAQFTRHACWGNSQILMLTVFTFKIQMNLILGDPPSGVWALYRDVSCQGSRVNAAFDLTEYGDVSLKLKLFCPIIV